MTPTQLQLTSYAGRQDTGAVADACRAGIAEIDRLRSALKYIADREGFAESLGVSTEACTLVVDLCRTAKRVLEGGNGTD